MDKGGIEEEARTAAAVVNEENEQTKDKVFLTVVFIWLPVLAVGILGLIGLGYDGREGVGMLLTVGGLAITLIDRRKPKEYLYNLGLILALAGVVVAQGWDIVAALI